MTHAVGGGLAAGGARRPGPALGRHRGRRRPDRRPGTRWTAPPPEPHRRIRNERTRRSVSLTYPTPRSLSRAAPSAGPGLARGPRLRADARLPAGREHLGAGGGQRRVLDPLHDRPAAAHRLEPVAVASVAGSPRSRPPNRAIRSCRAVDTSSGRSAARSSSSHPGEGRAPGRCATTCSAACSRVGVLGHPERPDQRRQRKARRQQRRHQHCGGDTTISAAGKPARRPSSSATTG